VSIYGAFRYIFIFIITMADIMQLLCAELGCMAGDLSERSHNNSVQFLKQFAPDR